MKKLMILASLALLSACSVDELPDNTEVNEEYKTITVPLSTGSTDTRVSVNDETSSSSSWKFEWEEDETVGVWDDSSTSFTEFTMSKHDPDMSSFTGEISEKSNYMRVISPYEKLTVSNNSCSIDISAQDGNLGKLYMMSEGMISVAYTATPEMKHLGGFFALYFKLANAKSDVTYIINEVKLSGVPTTMDVNLVGGFDDDSYYTNMGSNGTITATLDENVFYFNDATSMVEVRLNTLPFTFVQGESLTFDIAYTAGGTEYTTQTILTNTYGKDIDFERAKFNTFTITIDPTVNVSGATIDGWNVIEQGDLVATLPDTGADYDIALVDGVYEIYTAAGLNAFASIVNSGLSDFSGLSTEGIDVTSSITKNQSAEGKLMNDIDLKNELFTPIGNNYYYGTFDGDGHLVSGLKVNSTSNYVGLFAYISGATIQNLGVAGEVNGTYSKCVGGIAGYSYGATVINCYNMASVTATGYLEDVYAGGVVGQSKGSSIVNCYNMGKVCAESTYYYQEYETNITQGGTAYSGGIVGYSSGTVKICYSIGVVSASTRDGFTHVGGVVGYATSSSTIECYYWASDLAGVYLGIGTNTSNNSTESKSSSEMQDDSFVNSLNSGVAAYGNAAWEWVLGTDGYPTINFGVNLEVEDDA